MKEFIIRVIGEWYAEILAGLFGMFFIWFLGLLPSRYQYHKRLNFALKVKKAISKIDISIETKDYVKISQIKKELEEFIEKHSMDETKSTQNDFSFFSNETGATYSISSLKDEEINKNFVVVHCMNAFNLGVLGRISGLRDVINEFQVILDCFSNLRKNKDKITVHISITPRWKFLKDEGIKVTSSRRDVETIYNIKNIKLVNNGVAYLKENISNVFYDWMVALL
jgi:hypothetical protein